MSKILQVSADDVFPTRYRANSISLAKLANGQDVVRIEYAAPSPLGLLSG